MHLGWPESPICTPNMLIFPVLSPFRKQMGHPPENWTKEGATFPMK